MIIRDIKEDRGIFIGKMYSALFDRDIDVMMKSNNADYAEKLAEYFNNMPAELIEELKKYTLRYCEDFRQFFDEESPEVPEGVTENEIFNYVLLHVLIIEVPKASDKIAFSLEFGCAWEPEHGMEWAIKDGKAMYVGDFQGIGACHDDSVYQKNCMNYVFNEHCID